MTVPRILVGVAVLLGLLSTGLGRTMRLEKPHNRPMSAPSWSGESAPLDTNRLALVIGNSTYPDAGSPLPQMTRDAEGLTNALRKDGFLVDAVDNATRRDMTRAIDHLRARVHLNSIVLFYFGGYGVQSEGARVTLVDRSPLVEAVGRDRRIRGIGGFVDRRSRDMGRQYRGDEDHAQGHGAVDILVTNFGGAIWMKPFQHFDEKQIAAEVQRSLFPTLWGCRAALPYMLEQGRGAIVNVSSVATKGVNRAPYSAAKGAVNGLTSALGFELGTKDIRVNAVAPGGTTTPPRAVPRNATAPNGEEKAWSQSVVSQTIESSHMKRYGLLREMSAAILFLASDAASYITGTVLPVGGGDQG